MRHAAAPDEEAGHTTHEEGAEFVQRELIDDRIRNERRTKPAPRPQFDPLQLPECEEQEYESVELDLVVKRPVDTAEAVDIQYKMRKRHVCQVLIVAHTQKVG